MQYLTLFSGVEYSSFKQVITRLNDKNIETCTDYPNIANTFMDDLFGYTSDKKL